MSDERTMLIADDIELNRFLLREMFSDSYQIIEAIDGEDTLEKIQMYKKQLTIILLDVMMPKKDGFEVLAEIQKDEELANIPVIMITAIDGTEIKALQKGVWDYIQKPYDIEVAKSRVENAVKRSTVKQILKQEKVLYQKKLNYISEYDVLTGIYNKNTFFKCVKNLVEENPSEEFVIVRIDINRFKSINELFGKHEGDRLLCYIAKIVKEETEKKSLSTYGRIEGDIFCSCFAFKEGKQEIIEWVKAIEHLLAAYRITFEVVPSFGLYIVKERTLPVDLMCDRANLALATIKGNYVTKYAFYDKALHDKILQEQEIVSQMKSALAKEQFTIYLQPKCHLLSGKIIGAEALVRWIHPQKGVIAPGEFIPIFERNGFIMKLDAFVWEKTCQLIKAWIDMGKTPLPVSVNISRINLYNPELCDILIHLVEKYEIEPRLLQLELTESAYTDNPKLLSDIMARLQKYGFLIMMDDFGSGYSSLNMLKDVPVDVLKIDLKFLADDTGTMGRGANILSSIVRMAKWLALPVIVEGVETKEQVDFLRSIGCTKAQGYYFARPMSIQEFEQNWIQNIEEGTLQKEALIEQFKIDEIWEKGMKSMFFLGDIIGGYGIFERSENGIEAIRLSDTFFEMVGTTREEYYSNVFSELEWVKEEDKDVFNKSFRDAAEKKATAGCVYTRKCIGSRLIRIFLRVKYITGDKERQIFLAFMNDVTSDL